MAAFTWEEAKADWRSYDLFRHAPVTLFIKNSLLDDTIQHLEEQAYFVPQIDCRIPKTESDFYNSILFALNVLDSEYKNIQPIQFWDLATETKFDGHKGIALVFRHFDTFHNQFPECIETALSILSGYQYRWLWFGNRFTTIVQTGDPLLQLQPVWQIGAHWNSKEHFIKNRVAD